MVSTSMVSGVEESQKKVKDMDCQTLFKAGVSSVSACYSVGVTSNL